jgi:hypothetical protein
MFKNSSHYIFAHKIHAPIYFHKFSCKRGIINGVIDAELEGEKFWTRRELLEILRPL